MCFKGITTVTVQEVLLHFIADVTTEGQKVSVIFSKTATSSVSHSEIIKQYFGNFYKLCIILKIVLS